MKYTVWLTVLEPHTLAQNVLCWTNWAGNPRVCGVCDIWLTVLHIRSLVSIFWTELYRLSVLELLHVILSCCLGTLRIGFHWYTMNRSFTNVEVFFSFYAAYTGASVTNWAFLRILHMDFKNFNITIYNQKYKPNTRYVRESSLVFQ